MCGFLEKAMAGMEVPDHELRQAEIAFLRSTDEQRAIAARQLLRIRISMATRQPQPYQEWVPLNLLSRWVPMISGESDYDYFTPPHGEIFIPSLIQSPAAVPDMIFRHGIYQTFRNVLFAATHSTNFSYFPPRKNLDYAIDEKLKWIVSAGLGAPALDDVLAGVGLLDRTYGVTLGADFEPKIAKLRPQGQPGSFGSKGQFPILNYEGTVDTKLLIDVRNGVTDQPAMITHAMIDPTNHHILWLALQPYQDLDFRLQEPCPSCGSGYTIPPFEVAQPWLVAIDCRDGSTLRKINLATIPGLWSQAPPTTMYLEEFGQSFLTGIFANDTHLLVQIFWGRPSGTPVQQRSSMNALVSINRLTGEVNKHLVDTCLLNTQLVATNGSDQPAVVGIGTSFFVAEKWDAPILSQLIPGRVPKLLTQSGRRPEESPFDREDRKIALLRNDHGRLLVASSWEHFAYYDPAKQHWDDAPKRSAAEWRSYVLEIDRNAYWARYAHYQFKPANGDADACQFDYRDEATQPARLKFQIGDGPMSYLPVRMSIPDSYRARFQVASDGGVALKNPADRKYEWINIADMARSSMAIPAILNQTENHLVLATRVTSGIHVSATEPTYLPFLWIMNKSEAQAAMNRAQAK